MSEVKEVKLQMKSKRSNIVRGKFPYKGSKCIAYLKDVKRLLSYENLMNFRGKIYRRKFYRTEVMFDLCSV